MVVGGAPAGRGLGLSFCVVSDPFDSEDDVCREPRNMLYIGATLAQEIRDAVSGLLPFKCCWHGCC